MKSIHIKTTTDYIGQYPTDYYIDSTINSNADDTHHAFVELNMNVAASGTDNYDSKIPEFENAYKIEKSDYPLNVELSGVTITLRGEKEIKVFNQHLKYITEEIDKMYPQLTKADPYPINTIIK